MEDDIPALALLCCATALAFSTSRAVHSFSSSELESSSVYWYWVRLTRSSTVMFWTGSM